MTPSIVPAVSVFDFLDAREFLKKAYDGEKKRNPDFSHRYISKIMNAGSSSFFRDILHGRARFTPERVSRFAALFRLSKRETEYFENLVLYSQAETPEEKERRLRKLTSGASLRSHSVLETFQMEYLRKWHYAAVRELLAFHDFQGDYDRLAEMLDPPISAAEAMEAVRLLLELNLIRKNAQGRYEKVDSVVTSGAAEPEHARPGLRASLELAQRALGHFSPAARPFSYQTLSVSPESLQYIKDRLRMLRKEILDVVSRDEAVDRLYQLNLQLFPLSVPGSEPAARSKS